MALSLPVVQAQIYFLQEDKLFRSEKPFAFRYGVADAVPQTNMVMVPRVVELTNIRGYENAFSLEKNGFEVFRTGRTIHYDEFFDDNKVQEYLRTLEALLKIRLEASHVEVFRYAIRKRHPNFPVSTGDRYEYDQPTSVAHIDTTPEEMAECALRLPKEKSLIYQGKRIQWINVWKPLRGPLHDWPLTLCDPRNIEAKSDIESADLLYPDIATENYQIYYRDHYRWYYLGGQEETEAIVFIQADNGHDTLPGVPHCSFENPNVPEGERPRESIEVRLLVVYDN